MTKELTHELINTWAYEHNGSVALHLKQKLLPVEGEGGVIFPPTYADIGYNIDTLSDGTKVATIDSVGAQANRIEPIFNETPYSNFVPQIEIEISGKDKETNESYIRRRSIFDLAHRGADATVYACPSLAPVALSAFRKLKYQADAGPLTRLFPTSLVFGIWDSRGGSGEKRPRLIRSMIRAWDVEELHTAAQFNSIKKSLDHNTREELEKESSKKGMKKLSDVGLDDAPAVFRKVSNDAEKHMSQFRNGSPNPERRNLGGVIARGPIERDVTINLVALRRLAGANAEETKAIRRYLLSLTLLAATADIELYLREGCLLRIANNDQWTLVPRRGNGEAVDLASDASRTLLQEYAKSAADHFRKEWPEKLVHKFDLVAAKEMLAKTLADGEES
jgi:CRISPR-associated protein Csb1